MKPRVKQKLRTGALLICTLIILSPSTSVKADDIADLENKTSTLTGQLNGLNQEMVEISDEISLSIISI